MSNPNRTLANMSKNPWILQKTWTFSSEAHAHADQLKAGGRKARVTSYKYGSRDNPRRAYNVWMVEE